MNSNLSISLSIGERARVAHKSLGFTLLELLVTIMIGTFISLAATSFLTKTAQSYNNQDMTARIQENARFAIQAMSYDTRQAGFFGCSLIAPDNFAAIEGEDNSASSMSDTLTIRYARADLGAYDVNNPLTGERIPPSANTNTILLFNAGTGIAASNIDLAFEPGDEIIVSDCFKSEVAQVKEASGNQLVLSEGLKNNYLAVTQVYFASNFTYEVKPATQTEPSQLIRTTTLTTNGDEIVEPLVQGIDYMRVLYGVYDLELARPELEEHVATDRYNVPDAYIPWDDRLLQTSRWRIQSIKVGLMARSISNNRKSKAGQYGASEFADKYDEVELLDLKFNQLNLSEEDRVSRRTFVNTLKVRNQL